MKSNAPFAPLDNHFAPSVARSSPHVPQPDWGQPPIEQIRREVRRYTETPRDLDTRLRRWAGDAAWGLLTILVGVGLLLVGAVTAAAIWFAELPLWWTLLEAPLFALALVAVALFERSTARADLRKAEQTARTAPATVLHVVQANVALYEEDCFGPRPALVCYSSSPERIGDVEYGQWLCRSVKALRHAAPPAGPLLDIWKAVNDDHSTGRTQVPPGVCGDEQSYVETVVVSQYQLPGRCLPRHGMVLALLGPRGPEVF